MSDRGFGVNVHVSIKSLKPLKVYYQRTDMHLKLSLTMSSNASAKAFKKTARKKDTQKRDIVMFTLA